jgi:uncharacterized protein (UPF0332 family)
MIENLQDYIDYRIQKAYESYADAELLAKNGRWNAVVNRLYYACFYAVIALLLSKDIKSTTHDGGRNQFGLHFLKTGNIDKKYGKHFSKLFDLRQKGDYGDLYDYDEVIVEPPIPMTKEFIEEIKRHIVS